MNRFKAIIAFIFLSLSASAQGPSILPEHTRQAREIVSQMTLREKLEYIGGYEGWKIRPIPRLGLPAVRMADGPQGVRNNTKSTLYPSGITTAACWDRTLMYNMGLGLGRDSKARGVQILLGPGVNIYRMPLCGRNFEYFGEDPFLASEMAVSYINGLQSQNVMACIKHFAGNNQEYARHSTSTDVDLRTLHELYLLAFEKAVKKSNVGSIMNSYNLLNSVHATESEYLNKTVLREDWGFKGILMSDWTATYSPLNAATNGLDIEMPEAKSMTVENLEALISNGVLDIRHIDEKCVNIIQTIIAWGWMDEDYSPIDKSIALNDSISNANSLAISRSAMTLLTNKEEFLPKNKGRFFVCGPHSDIIVTGGGSGNVSPIVTSSVFDGMQSMGKKIKVGLSRTTDFTKDFYSSCFVDAECTKQGIKAEYFKGLKPGVDLLKSFTIKEIDFNWDRSAPCDGVPKDKFSARYTFNYMPSTDEYRIFSLGADDAFRMYIDGEEVLSDWVPHSYKKGEYSVFLEKNRVYKFVIEYYDEGGKARVDLLSATNMFDRPDELKALSEAECAIVCIGFNSKTEGENFDRKFELPAGQIRYLEEVLKYNPNVVVVVNSGGAFEMASWMDKVKAVIWSGYPGQHGGTAIAEIITGKICPSGRLPFSMERKIEDNPCFASYYENVKRIRTVNPYSRVQYNEGLFTGYRGYDRNNVKPLFPFGYGMSYTKFEYNNLELSQNDKGEVEVSFDITNVGKMDGSDVSQVYIREINPTSERPFKELKGFEKVRIQKGKTEKVNIILEKDAFRQYDAYEKSWKQRQGEYEIMVGRSSEEILLTKRITIN